MPARDRALADVVQALMPEDWGVTRAARLRTAQDGGAGNDPDTVWIGHIYDATYTAGGRMPAGGYGPYKVGRGPNRPTKLGGKIGDNGTWDFDRFQVGETDSLQGWWPVTRPFQAVIHTFVDYRTSFSGLSHGNTVNYVINQGAPKRTFGVVGLWHRDAGNTADLVDSIGGTNVQPVLWSPTEVGGVGSTASAWMGMRSHGDLSHRDLVSNGGTGNAFNSSLLDYAGTNGENQIGSEHLNGTDHNFPGYGAQMDQMLYRDIPLAENDGLTISFNFSTNMSTGKNEVNRVGWFDKDPISPAQTSPGPSATPTSDGNYISSSVAQTNAPCDSFMVYVGAPVNDDDVTFSAPLFVGINEITTVYDKQRRWFSEVLKLSGYCSTGSPCSIIGKEIASYTGIHPPTAVSVNFGSLYPTALQAIKNADGTTGDGGKVRIVFRVKTNRGWDDQNTGNPGSPFNSGTRGAVIVDNVVVNGWAEANGDFEAVEAINNDTAVDATNAWKSTGRPPGVYFHAHSVNTLAFNDPCGGLDNPNRQCNLYGKVITSGDHDFNEKDGGSFGSNTQDRLRWFASPTINLRASGNGPGLYNAMGIDDEVAITTTDYDVFYSYYNAGNVMATTTTGQFVSIGWQSYPARQINGNIKWGETRHTPSIFQYGTRACFETFSPVARAKANGLIRTTNAQNRPDSLRVYLQRIGRCYAFGLVAATCAPTTGDFVGTYFDNVSVALIDGAAPPAISISIWDLINDAFPANRNDAVVTGGPTTFDTTAAQIRTGLNRAVAEGSVARPNISGDSVVVAANGNSHRLDMVFRILPGPGNYNTTGAKSSGVKKRPDQAGAATPNDGSFFGEYMASAGQFASHASHLGAGPGGTNWSQHIWNSARMDTVEQNLFRTANNGFTVGLTPGVYRGTYHESDGKYATLGITKNICIVLNPSMPAVSPNIGCNGFGWEIYGAGSGWDGVKTTKEHTKIIPDGLLTPGSHVQYFFRKCDVNNTAVFEMGPDTNFVFQPSEGSTDGHRWQQFGVLPDRWKDGAWPIADRNAGGPACMLYIDWADRRGDERTWVGIADSLGWSDPSRWGAHNGWHARGDQDITVAIATDPTIAVYTHGGQPGTMWDMYGVKASESGTTSTSLGPGTAATGLQFGKDDRRGPTGLMLRTYYRILMILTGDLAGGNIGPYPDKSSNDVGLLNDFASVAAGTSKPRGVWVMGRSFMEGQMGAGTNAHPTWPPAYFGAGLVSGDYRTYAGNTIDIVDLTPNAPVVTDGSRYSVLSNCVTANDVLSVQGTFGAVMAAKYADGTTGANPKIASVYAPSTFPGSADHEAITLVEGFRISSFGRLETMSSPGRILYLHRVFGSLFASLNCPLFETIISVGETPNNPLVHYLALRSENPHRGGDAEIRFGITQKERVELKLYDVTGRLVRTLANREFAAGEHDIVWDGSDDEGRLVPRGVYFYQLRTPSFVSQKKLAVLRH